MGKQSRKTPKARQEAVQSASVGDGAHSLLKIAISSAVPLWIMQMQHQDWEYIQSTAQECSKVIAEKGDLILFRSAKKGETANAFNRLAEGIACLAFAPGGVTFLGLHFEAKHRDSK